MNESVNDKGVCRTAPATLGLFKNTLNLSIETRKLGGGCW